MCSTLFIKQLNKKKKHFFIKLKKRLSGVLSEFSCQMDVIINQQYISIEWKMMMKKLRDSQDLFSFQYYENEKAEDNLHEPRHHFFLLRIYRVNLTQHYMNICIFHAINNFKYFICQYFDSRHSWIIFYDLAVKIFFRMSSSCIIFNATSNEN